jgi:hypothetical protein
MHFSFLPWTPDVAHIPSKVTCTHNVTFHKMTAVYYGAKLSPAQPQNCWTSSCWLSTAAYSTHSQLPSVSGGLLFHPKLENAPCLSDLLNMSGEKWATTLSFSILWSSSNVIVLLHYSTLITETDTVSLNNLLSSHPTQIHKEKKANARHQSGSFIVITID